MADFLNNSVKFVPGVGEARAKLLEKELGIITIGDLLRHYPFRYIDRTRIYRIAEVNESMDSSLVQIRARVTGVGYAGTGRKQRFSAFVSDASGSAELTWFAGIKWIEKSVEVGREYLIFGRPSFYRGELQLAHPEMELVEKALSRKAHSGMQGIYPSTEKIGSTLGTKGFFNIIANAWNVTEKHITESIPDSLRAHYGLMSLREAIFNVHFPQSAEKLQQAQQRLKFDEFLGVQLSIQAQRTDRLTRRNGFLFPKVGDLFNTFFNERLPFALTGAQKRVIKEIRQDTVSGYQMNRLLQGDVGSGKTMVALMSMLLAVDNGFQACMMAPTEILARQHFATISRQTEGMNLRVAILTGSSKAAERRHALEGIASGEVNILIGTHALIEDKVQFANLGYVVIDEQHRFGVEQRARLWTKNQQPPHILVMTATPIPRTLAMTLYGDLDVSVIDELPPGRQPIRTYHYTDSARLKLWGFLREQIAAGRQVYVVYPLIQESETMDYKDLEDGFQSIVQDFPQPDYRVTVCHGKMKPQDKEESMRQFKEHEADILVATSVIEVGVDVPNATVMVIESAERFGLSQLHQLRGRVGRGGGQSYCILMSGEKLSREARKRLQAMCQTTDGFRLAELDMQLRGAGDINGTQQSGMAFDLKIANPTLDADLLQRAREAAIAILSRDPQLEHPENRGLRTLRARHAGGRKFDFSMIS
ncbi:MAG: ATP-dependent DNA helicase RecG [Rikenellaceae bacterium]|nr:ATP-dependent DNA helicase RecG [Rikenellaceae bacterium]